MPLTIDDITDPLVQAAVARLPLAIRPAALLYAPAITRMGAADFWALLDKSQAKSTAAAMDLLRKSMTVEELADEKEVLAEGMVVMARESFEARQAALAILQAAIGVALSAATF